MEEKHGNTAEKLEKAEPGKLHQMFEGNFLEYTAYVIRDRAIPDINDGLKPVQRRILQTLFNMDDGRFHKVANVVGETMKLHPHGDQSIFAALVNLANKDYLIERQGNFGNIYTGDQASAARYIECRLTPLAREALFNKDLTQFVDSYDGRMEEPVTLPARLPMLLLLGAEGIAVGMATKIMPHNFQELLQAQIAILRGEEFTLHPDFPRGGIIDASAYDHGNGRIRCRARIEEKDEKTIVIRELPYNITTQALIESVEKAAKAGMLKIQAINDYTAEQVEVEISLARGVYAAETIDALYAFTDCELSIVPNLVLIRDNMPRQLGVEEVLHHNTAKLKTDLEKELRIALGRLKEKLHARKLEQIFIEERLYKQIEEKTSFREVTRTVRASLLPYQGEFLRAVSQEDVERLLEIRIKRISRYDISKQRQDIRRIEQEIGQIEKDLQDMVGFTIRFLEEMLEKYGSMYPRRSELQAFDAVDARTAAISNLSVAYNRASGFLGHLVKKENEEQDLEILCSEFDRILLLYGDGRYRVIRVEDKFFAGPGLLWMGKVEDGLVFNMIYRNGAENLSYAKRFTTPKFIIGREYRLFDEHPRSQIQILRVGDQGIIFRASLVPSGRARHNAVEIDMGTVLIKGPAALGKRVSSRVVRRVSDQTGKARPEKQGNLSLPGLGEPDSGSDLSGS